MMQRVTARSSQPAFSLGPLFVRNAAFRQFHSTPYNHLPIIPFILTDVGEGIAECEVIQWHTKVGDYVNEFDPVCELQSDKANLEVTSRYEGKVVKIHHKVGAMAKVGAPLIDIDTGGDEEVKKEEGKEVTKTTTQSQKVDQASKSTSEKALATPSVRRIARENNIDLGALTGTGKDGRIMKEDILNFLKPKEGEKRVEETKRTDNSTLGKVPKQPAPQQPTLILPKEDDVVVPVKGVMKGMVKAMTESLAVPQLGFCEEIIVDELLKLREQLIPVAEKRNIKLTPLPIILKITSLALTQFPIMNSSLSADTTSLIYKASHNIGVAMATPSGLLVPNIKNVQHKSIMAIAAELNHLQELGKQGKLTTEELSNGTFSVSNIGAIGGTYAHPIISPPEVAIGALGKIQRLPRFDETDPDKVLARQIMAVSWSADHRVIDGATIANFSNLWKQYMQDPVSMIGDL